MTSWFKLLFIFLGFSLVVFIFVPPLSFAQSPAQEPCNPSFDPNNVDQLVQEKLTKDLNSHKTCFWSVCLEDIGNDIVQNTALKVVSIVGRYFGDLDEINELTACSDPKKEPLINEDGQCVCVPAGEYAVAPAIKLCTTNIVLSINDTQSQQDRKIQAYEECVQCALQAGIWTALGCIYVTNPQDFITRNVFGLGLGIAGISSFLCIIIGGGMIAMSRGNAEKIKQARELMTSCVTGLLIIILSVLILRVIGVDILRIPGLQ